MCTILSKLLLHGDRDDQLGGGSAACERNRPHARPAPFSRGLPLDASTRVSFAQALEEYVITHARSRQSTRWCGEGRNYKLLYVMVWRSRHQHHTFMSTETNYHEEQYFSAARSRWSPTKVPEMVRGTHMDKELCVKCKEEGFSGRAFNHVLISVNPLPGPPARVVCSVYRAGAQGVPAR